MDDMQQTFLDRIKKKKKRILLIPVLFVLIENLECLLTEGFH